MRVVKEGRWAMEPARNLLSVDCGNSSIRVMLCRYDGERLAAELVLQEPNDMVRLGSYYFWDMLRIFEIIKEGIRLASRRVERIHSLGICTWGVDFSFFEESGLMLSQPPSYRNAIGGEQMARFSPGELRQMFFDTGILSDKINSIFMLDGLKRRFPALACAGRKLLMVPDILHYFFTGRMVNEPSELSTTQLLRVMTGEISEAQCGRIGVDKSLFSPIGVHGAAIGNILPAMREELDIDYDLPVVCVPSHDTASAVMGVPTESEEFAFISAGTWALIGMHLDRPIVTQEVLEQSLTNEVGAFGHTTLLKNSVGLFIMQRLRKEYSQQIGRKAAWSELDALSDQYAGDALLFDVNHPDFFHPPVMSEAIWRSLRQAGHVEGAPDWRAILAAAQASLAVSYADGMEGVFAATGKRFGRVYVVGGGAKDRIITQCFADATGLEVVACEMECAAIGAAAAQLPALEPGMDFAALKRIVTDSSETKRYLRKADRSKLLSDYRKLLA